MAECTSLSGLADALGLGSHEHVALVGGGGKTTLLHALAAGSGTRVLTTTTKMAADQHGGRPVLLSPTDEQVAAAVRDGPVVVWRALAAGKALGISPERCDRLFDVVDQVIVEADGSRHLPFKAPTPFEPVVASTTTVMVSVIGAQALGRVIADSCHRPLRVAALAGCRPYERLSPAAAATVLTHPEGSLHALPAEARFAIAITRPHLAEPPLLRQLVEHLARHDPATVVVQVEDAPSDS